MWCHLLVKNISNTNKAKRANRAGRKITQVNIFIGLLMRIINKCPATMLAANRTDNVRGRITLLTISIKTINGIKGQGVPTGTKCDKKKFKLFKVDKSM